MSYEAIITICVILGAIILFATELLSIDLVAILIMTTLVIFGVITPEESVQGFSNSATITVAFMFVLSASLLKTGALQYLAQRLSQTFRNNFALGMTGMMLLVAFISAFINNTPVVAVFIPVVLQIAKASNVSASKMLIPLSFASILGGLCTLIGTSTNILISGMLDKHGLPELEMFSLTPIGIVFLIVGILYMVVLGIKLLPDRKRQKDLEKRFNLRDYVTQITLLPNNPSTGLKIMDAPLVVDHKMDILSVERNGRSIHMPQGDFILEAGDELMVRCDLEKIKLLKDAEKTNHNSTFKIVDESLQESGATLVELIITSNPEVEGKTLKEIDFRRRYRATPLAIQHKQDVYHNNLHDTIVQAGDIVLAEVKTHYISELQKLEKSQASPFILLSENQIQDFDRKKFYTVLSVLAGIITLASFGILNIMTGAIAGVILLNILGTINMKEAYQAINWKIIFLLAGSLTLGTAMSNSGLDKLIAGNLIEHLGVLGPIAILSGLYLTTSILTELISNAAAAVLLFPIAIATSEQLGVSYIPFVMAVTFAASASFMTPVGYQTNAMVFSAGQYKFLDFFKVGSLLSLLLWVLATLLIPIVYPF